MIDVGDQRANGLCVIFRIQFHFSVSHRVGSCHFHLVLFADRQTEFRHKFVCNKMF